MGDEASKRLREAPGDLGRLVDFVPKADDAVAAMEKGTHAFVEISTTGRFLLTLNYKVTETQRG